MLKRQIQFLRYRANNRYFSYLFLYAMYPNREKIKIAVPTKEIEIAVEVLNIVVVAHEVVVQSIVAVMKIGHLVEAEVDINGIHLEVPVPSIAVVEGITMMAVMSIATIDVINALDRVLAVLRIHTAVDNLMMMNTVVETITRSSSLQNKMISLMPMRQFPLVLLLLLFLVNLLLFSLVSWYSHLWA